jgi:hypothetical protein
MIFFKSNLSRITRLQVTKHINHTKYQFVHFFGDFFIKPIRGLLRYFDINGYK